ncbi:MAG TPA: 3-dehydro-L-gulonate 2-dehydrogenase [Anaerolineales bacterium]|nr:3-dehydro-L-gulonate 2-dehydrogenase [Anaerolineales bacterium]
MATIRVTFEEMKNVFQKALVKVGFPLDRAEQLAEIFAQNSLDGVASHGWNRFPVFMGHIAQGYIHFTAEPEKVAAMGAWEQWDGKLGAGPLNAIAATKRAMELAHEYGIGCVALRYTNHWMRGGTYGQLAAQAGFALICWTNAIATMPPHGSRDIKLGNNPLVLAVPRREGPVVLDIAMSQFAFGKLEVARRRGEKLPVPGGFDANGQPTQDAAVIMGEGRAMPIGYWKGSGLALLLDMTAALLSGGMATHEVVEHKAERSVSQVFIAFDVTKPAGAEWVETVVEKILADLQTAQPISADEAVLFPGERVIKTRQDNLANGIPVDESVWQDILKMAD